MAKNQMRFLKNIITGDTKPLIMLGKFQAGATQAIKMGELLELTGDTNTRWVPMDSDFSMSANVAIAACEIKSGDRAGYYPIIVPRPGDVFEYELAAAGATAVGTALYWSSSEVVTVTTGSNILGHAIGQEHYPEQGHTADDASPDFGETLRTISRVRMTIRAACSYYAALQK